MSEEIGVLLSVEQAAYKLGISEEVIRFKLRKGHMRGYKVFGRWRIEKREIDALIKAGDNNGESSYRSWESDDDKYFF